VKSSPARRYYNVMLGDLGEMRVGEFPLGTYTVRIIASKDQVRSVMGAYQDVVYWLLILMILVSGLIGFSLSKLLLRPLRLIQATATHIGSDNLSERIPVGAVKDELSDLARLLNQMFDRLEAAFNQTRRFTAEASHELKTPLSLVQLQAEKFLMEGGLKPGQEEAMQIQLEEIARLNQIIEELLFLSRAEAGAITLQAKPQDPAKFIESFSADVRLLAESRGIRFQERIAGHGRVSLDPKWLRQVLFNLVSNALKASPSGAIITLDSEVSDKHWRVSVQDSGPGVPTEQRERIFERFVRLGENDGGSGLGLTISRSIVQLHRGRIWAEEPSGGPGLRVIFEIPTA
jgi:signal transduction histidine kinase